MRTLEILLSLVNALALVALLVPLSRRLRWMRSLALLAPLTAGAQMLVEGWRWQMVPSYALSGVLCAVWIRQRATPEHAAARLGMRRLGGLLGVLALVASSVLPAVVHVVRFPHPTGPFGIGTLTYHWVDAARPEIFTPDPDDRRELMVQIWYPAEQGSSAPRAPYIAHADAVIPAIGRVLNFPALALGHLEHFVTNAVASAPVADERRFPLLILLIGRAGYRQAYTFQVEELVSQGYIVAAIEQPYAHARVVFPDGRHIDYDPRMNDRAFKDPHIPHLAQDVGFTLEKLAAVNRDDPNGILTGRLDLRHAGVFGQSLGGIVGSEACRQDPRLRACLLEDAFMPTGVVRDGLQQPTMWITRDAGAMRLERRRAGGWSEADIEEHQTTMRAVYNSLPSDGYFVQVPGMFHLDMTDASLLSPLAPRLGLAGPIDAARVHRIINAYSVAFFDRHLRGRPAPLLDGPSEAFPEVQIESRQ
jgi:predicted dienelactone hydrolase